MRANVNFLYAFPVLFVFVKLKYSFNPNFLYYWCISHRSRKL